MKRHMINLLAILLLAGGLWFGIHLYQSGESAAAQSKSNTPDRVRRPAGEERRPSPTPALVRKLTNPALHLDEQIEAVRALPSDLTKQEIDALIDLFRQPAPETVSITTWYVLLNEIMAVLRQPRFEWEGYGHAMAELMVDRDLDPVVRDYASQYVSLNLGAGSGSAADFSAGMEAYLTILNGEREAYEPVTGTAMMALADLRTRREAENFAPYDARLEKIITAYVTGARPASMSNQISAIQAAGRMGFREALPDIRRYARGEAPNPSVRLSSVAALGYFADPEDRSFLQDLANSKDRLRFAARQALKNHAP